MYGLHDAQTGTWLREEHEEDGTLEDRACLWRHLIQAAGDYHRRKTVLDHGCNRGGFLPSVFHGKPLNYNTDVKTVISTMRIAGGK
jgi:hypothetical protein